MMMMGRLEVFAREMTLAAQCVALETQLRAMGVMAIAAGHAGGMHLALQERSVHVDLVQDLPVGVIKTGIEQ